MSTTIKTGWLNDEQGNKFAPKTLTSQVQTNDGVLLEDKIQIDIEAAKTEILDKVALESIDAPIDDALSSTSENPVQNKVISERFDAVSVAIDTKIDTATVNSVYETKSDATAKLTESKGYTDEQVAIAIEYTDELSELVGTLPDGTSAKSVVDYVNIKTAGVSTDVAMEELQNQLNGKAEKSHTHDEYYTKTETDVFLESKSDAAHSHDDKYDAKGSADTALDEAKSYTDNAVSDFVSETVVDNKISIHNTSTSAHDDIRALITALSTEVNNFLDVDDTTKDQLSEILALIDNNKGTLDSLTTSKVNVSDIVDNLTTNVANKPLSSAQGVALKSLIDDLQMEVDGKADVSHNHDGVYATEDSIDDVLNEAKSYTDTKTSGLASTSHVSTQISNHNTSTSAHDDIRALITDLSTVVNNFLDVDDSTKDQLSEVLTLIENNRGTLESLTTSKINVSDIVNNLTTNSTDKVLSASQGVAIKGLIDALQEVVDGKSNDGHGHVISDVTNLQSTLNAKATQTSLDSHTSDTIKHITSTERTNWNAAKTHADSAHAPSNAQPNQNAFSNIRVGTTTVSADTTTDTVEFVGSNITITPDATNDKVTFTVANGSTSTAGIVQLTNSTSSTSTATAATPSSVKSAYDLANTAKNAAATAQATADGKAPILHSHYSLVDGNAGELTWSGDHYLSSTIRPNAKLHFGADALYRFYAPSGAYYPILDEGNYKSYSLDLNSNQTVGGNKVFTGTTSVMILHTYNPLYINNGTDNSKSTSLYTNDSNVFAITSSATDMTFNGENVALVSDVDTALSSALPKAGGTMTGALTLNANPVNAMEAATKQYVDNLVGLILNGAS